LPAEQAHCYHQATNEPAADDEKVMPHIPDTGAHYHNPAEGGIEGSALETALKESGITSVGKKIAPRNMNMNMNMKKTIMDTMLALRAVRMMAVSANPRQESTMPLPSMPARARRSFQKSRLFLRFWEIVSTLFFSGLPIYL